MKDFSVEDAQNEMRYLLTCCLGGAQFQPEDIALVRDAYDRGDEGRDGFRVYDLKDGRVAILQDGEDYTGHG
ncbi:MAG: hypothetical protein ACYTBS_21555 [Planctomycetota bacterium]